MSKKHECDGHHRAAVASEVKVGSVLRRVDSDGAIAPFSDTVVIGIWIEMDTSSKRQSFQTLQDSLSFATEYNYSLHSIRVEMARPYVYADTIGIIFNHLQGIERYRVDPASLLRSYKMVEMANGEIANYNNKRETTYEVVVGNVGTVYKGVSEREARETYVEYVDRSKMHHGGRPSGESVVMMRDGEIVKEHEGN